VGIFVPVLRLSVALFLLMLIPGVAVCAEAQSDRMIPLGLETSGGIIVIGLEPAAAPEAVSRLVKLVRGPIFAAEVRSAAAANVGYYEGLLFDSAVPGHQIATGIRPPASSILIPTEIDAKSLGLDRQYMSSSGEAMNRWQFEIMEAMTRIKGAPPRGTALARWFELWKEKGNADFLLKESEMEINEGLGWSYRDGLSSIPIRRGVVTLAPFDKKTSTPGLIIYLVDRPDLDGRQMAIGRVREGLELCDSISRRPLTPSRAEQLRPLTPIRIFKATIGTEAPGTIAVTGKVGRDLDEGGSP